MPGPRVSLANRRDRDNKISAPLIAEPPDQNMACRLPARQISTFVLFIRSSGPSATAATGQATFVRQPWNWPNPCKKLGWTICICFRTHLEKPLPPHQSSCLPTIHIKSRSSRKTIFLFYIKTLIEISKKGVTGQKARRATKCFLSCCRARSEPTGFSKAGQAIVQKQGECAFTVSVDTMVGEISGRPTYCRNNPHPPVCLC
jgi:hypothetical protein